MKIKDLILKTEKIDWQDLKDLQPINLKNNYHCEKTKQSIIKNGFARAIYVWQDKDKIKIIDGHLRTSLLIELKNEGYDIPDQLNCTFLDLPNKKTAIKYLLQVFNQKTNPINQESMEIWLDDNEIVLEDMEIELDELHIELSDELEVEEEQEEVKEDEVPEVKHNFVVKGDLFELIDEEQGLTHRVLCGDSTMIDDVEKVMNGEKADMVFTDPPYNVDYEGGSKKREKIKNDKLDDFSQFLSSCFSNMYVFMKDGGCIYISHSELERLSFTETFKMSGFQLSSVIIWVKNNSTFSMNKDYKWKHEPIIYGWKKGGHIFYGDNTQDTVWLFDRPSESKFHPTMKPINLITKAINNSSKQKDLVIDFFLGSGSTLIACQQTKRNCYGLELDEHYCGVVITRWKNYMEKEGKKYSIKRNGEQFTLENGSSNII